MRNLNGLILMVVLIASTAYASTTRIVTFDQHMSSDLSKTYSYPSATDTILGRISTDTLTNKSMSGASNTFSAIPVTAIGNGSVLSGTNTGDVTIGTANGLSLSLQALSLTLSSTSTTGALSSTDWNTFNNKLSSSLTTGNIFVGVGGVATSTAVSGDITNSVGVFTIGAKKVQASKLDSGAAANGTVATADGSGGVSYLAVPSGAPTIVGSTGSPTLITAAGGISFSGSSYNNLNFIAGNAGAIDITATPQITAGTLVGQELQLISESATNTVKLDDGTGLLLNGSWVGGLGSSITLRWDGTVWAERSRQ